MRAIRYDSNSIIIMLNVTLISPSMDTKIRKKTKLLKIDAKNIAKYLDIYALLSKNGMYITTENKFNY